MIDKMWELVSDGNNIDPSDGGVEAGKRLKEDKEVILRLKRLKLVRRKEVKVHLVSAPGQRKQQWTNLRH